MLKCLESKELSHQRIVKKIVEGLKEILIRIDNGTIQIDKDAEDIHSFVESILTYYIGDEGKKTSYR